jgi:hypothetical protein
MMQTGTCQLRSRRKRHSRAVWRGKTPVYQAVGMSVARWSVWLACLALVPAGRALADPEKAEAYKKALSANSECGTIPDPLERESCVEANKSAGDACATQIKSTCNAKKDGQIKEVINRIKTKLGAIDEAMKTRTADLDERYKAEQKDGSVAENWAASERARAKVDDDDRKIAGIKAELSDVVDELKKLLGERRANGDACRRARAAVHDFFVTAARQAASETDADVKPFAAQLIARWEAGDKQHATENANLDTSIRNCEVGLSDIASYLQGVGVIIL